MSFTLLMNNFKARRRLSGRLNSLVILCLVPLSVLEQMVVALRLGLGKNGKFFLKYGHLTLQGGLGNLRLIVETFSFHPCCLE
jgi:hypothetical protein